MISQKLVTGIGLNKTDCLYTENEYKQYCKALKDTHTAWLGEWKGWCDVSRLCTPYLGI